MVLDFYLQLGLALLAVIVLAILGFPIARRFLKGLVVGTDVFVVLEINGRTRVYKNPNQPFQPVDEPLAIVPDEIFRNENFETYYNVCWFDDLGRLYRCEHSYHRKPENAEYCERRNVEGSMVGKVLEEK